MRLRARFQVQKWVPTPPINHALKVFPTVCERGTGLDLLNCIDAHDLLWTSPVPDPSISRRLGDLSHSFKGIAHAPSLLVIVWFDHRAPSVPAKQAVGPFFGIILPAPICRPCLLFSAFV